MARGKKAAKALTPEERLEQALVPEEEQPYAVPENWCWTRIGNVTEVVGGGTPSSNVVEYYENGTIPWISPADLSGYHGTYIFSGAKNITSLGLEKSSAKMIPENTVCLSSRAPIGYVVIAGNPLCTNQGFKSFLPSPCFLPKYLYWYLKGNKELLEHYASGTTFLELSGKKAALVEFPLPPLAEQQRIVDRIESLFARLDEAKEKAQAVLDGFELRKSAILHKAFSGELTERWREEQGVGLDSWENIQFGNLITDIQAGKNWLAEGRPPQNDEFGVVKVSAVTWGNFDELESKTCTNLSQWNEAVQIKAGDFLFSRANTLQLVGNCVIVKNISKRLMLSDKILRLTFGEEIIPQFVLYFTQSKLYRAQIEGLASGNQDGMRNISQKNFKLVKLLRPVLEEQREIVHILDSLLAKEQQVKEATEFVFEQIDTMKKAILARAFRGELGTNDLEEESSVELLKETYGETC